MIIFELLTPPELEVSFDVSVVGKPYTGEYQVTPKIYNAVNLPAKNKTMLDDITVLKIPQYEVSNEAGGNTLIMGDEYYG